MVGRLKGLRFVRSSCGNAGLKRGDSLIESPIRRVYAIFSSGLTFLGFFLVKMLSIVRRLLYE